MARQRAAPTIADVGEFGFLAKLLPHFARSAGTVVGPGHDCAVIRCGRLKFLFTVDALLEGVHYKPGWMSPQQIGRKSFLVNASDVAAMGGQPRFCVVSLGVPATFAARDLLALEAGIVAAARECGTVVVGGNLARAEQLFVSIALLAGAPKRIITRAGARRGDRVYVTGTLGDAALGVRLLSGEHALRRCAYPIRRFREPSPRLQAGRLLAELGIASAMIDVSDGLVQDLGHLCEQSHVGAVLHVSAVPLSAAYRRLLASRRLFAGSAQGAVRVACDGQPAATQRGADLPAGRGAQLLALHGGEDYELLCTVPERTVVLLERNRARLGCPITCIGEITAAPGIELVDGGGTPIALESLGFDHFRTMRKRRKEKVPPPYQGGARGGCQTVSVDLPLPPSFARRGKRISTKAWTRTA
jgi:thiamine-monophosphate kinase